MRRPHATGPPVCPLTPKPDDDGELRQEPLCRRLDHDHPLDGDHHG